MIETKDDFVKTFKSARRVSTPLMAVRTPDPASAIQAVRLAHDAATATPLLHWDIVHGLAGLNKPGREETSRIVGGADSSLASVRPSDVLEMAEKLSEDSILFFANAHRFFSDPVVVQGIWNLRDGFKVNGRMFIMLTIPGAVLPPELAQDALVLDEPLPSADDLLRIIKETFSAAALAEPEPPL